MPSFTGACSYLVLRLDGTAPLLPSQLGACWNRGSPKPEALNPKPQTLNRVVKQQ